MFELWIYFVCMYLLFCLSYLPNMLYHFFALSLDHYFTCWLVDLFKLTFRDEFLTSSFDNFCANCGIDACYLFLCLVWVLSLCIDYDLTLMWHLSQGCSSTYMHTPLPAHVWIEFVFLKWFVRGFFLCMFVCFDWWIGTFYTVLYVY